MNQYHQNLSGANKQNDMSLIRIQTINQNSLAWSSIGQEGEHIKRSESFYHKGLELRSGDSLFQSRCTGRDRPNIRH